MVADAGYGIDGRFRKGVTELKLEYVMGVQSSASVWEPGKQPLPAKPYSGTGRPPRLLRRDKDHNPVSVKQLALMLPAQQWKTVNWREGTKHQLRSRFAAVWIRPAHRDDWQAVPHPEEYRISQKGQPFGGRDPAILRTGGQTGELPCCCEPVGCHLDQQPSHSLAALPAGDLGQRSAETTKSRHPGTGSVRRSP